MIEMFQVTFFKYDQNQLIIDANSRSKNKWEFTPQKKRKRNVWKLRMYIWFGPVKVKVSTSLFAQVG